MKQYLIGYDKQKTPTVVFFDISDFDESSLRDVTVLSFVEEEIEYTYTGTNGRDFKEVHKSAPDFYTYEVIDDKEYKRRGLDKHFGKNNNSPASGKGSSKKKSTGSPKIVNINGKGVFGIPGGLSTTITLSTGKVIDIMDPAFWSNLTKAEKKEVEQEVQKIFGPFLGQLKKSRGGVETDVEVDFSKDKNNPTIRFPETGDVYTTEELMDLDNSTLDELAEDNDIDIAELLSEINAHIFKGTTGKVKISVSSYNSSASQSGGHQYGGCGGYSGCGYSGGSCGGGCGG